MFHLHKKFALFKLYICIEIYIQINKKNCFLYKILLILLIVTNNIYIFANIIIVFYIFQNKIFYIQI